MYQLSRAIYRELSPDISDGVTSNGETYHEAVLRACEHAIERLATDRLYFARPARSLFNDIRGYFPLAAQARVWTVVQRYVSCIERWLATRPRAGFDVNGNPIRCRATTRRGTPCRREPLPANGYCPSHQHLVETEQIEAIAA